MGSETSTEASTPTPTPPPRTQSVADGNGASYEGSKASVLPPISTVPALTTTVAPPAVDSPRIPTPARSATGPRAWRPATAAGAKPDKPPRIERPAPRLRQLMGVCGWAAVLGGIGLVIGLRGHIGILAGNPPTWYEPSLITVGVIGILLTVGAFLTVHRRRAPWILLGTSSIALIVAMGLTSNAF